MTTVQSPFEIVYEEEPQRVIRGQVERSQEAGDANLPWVLLVHGFKGFMDWGFFPLLSRGLAEAGFQVVRCNLSGSGVGADLVDFSDLDSFTKDSYGRQLEDMQRVADLAASGDLGPVEQERCGYFGHSRGGGMGLVHAAGREYRGIVTWSAIDDADRFDDEAKEVWRRQGYLGVPNLRTGQEMRMGLDGLLEFEADPARFDILGAAARVQAPTLVLHGTADQTVDPGAAGRIAAALPRGKSQLLDGAGHTLGATHPLQEVPPALAKALALTVDHFLAHV